MMVVFDLPVVSFEERKRATGFRTYLLDLGFTMMQFSVYLRFTSGKEQAGSLVQRIGRKVPYPGKVDIVFLTDKQYETIVSFRGRKEESRPAMPAQLLLF